MEREKRWRLSVMFYFTQSCSILSVFNHKHFLITNTRSSKEHWVEIISYVAFLFFCINLSKGQIISKDFLVSSDSSKKGINKFVFLEESEDTKKSFEIIWPLAYIWIKGSYLDQILPQHESLLYSIGQKTARIEIPHCGNFFTK